MKRVVWLAVLASVGCKNSNSGPAKIAVDQAELLFGQETGQATLLGTSIINTLQITNTGFETLTISSVSIAAGGNDPCGKDPAQFVPCGTDSGLALDSPQVFVASAASSTSLAPGAIALLQVTFTPPTIGQFGAVLTIASNASNTPSLTVELDGDCVGPVLGTPGWDGGVIDLGSIPLTTVTLSDGGQGYLGGLWPDGGIPTATFTVSNLGATDLQFSTETDGGNEVCSSSNCPPGSTTCPVCAQLSTDAGDPSVVIPTWNVVGPNPVDLPPVKASGTPYTALITVTFGPYFPGDYTQHVNVATNDSTAPMLSFTVHAVATPDGGSR